MTDHAINRKVVQAYKEKKVSKESFEAIKQWLEGTEYQPYHSKIIAIIKQGRWGVLDDSFRTKIPFGTGGRRGPRGVGPNRINERTIGESAQGLANYLSNLGDQAKKRGVAIAYDTRIKSKEFATLCAEILAGNGIQVFLFDRPRSTPELSFTVRHLKTQAGVVISASHNPPTDNGIKVYWDHGGQVIPPQDQAIMTAVSKASSIRRLAINQAQVAGLVQTIGKAIDHLYWHETAGLTRRGSRSAQMVFSPLHGTGSNNVLPVLKQLGYKVSVVKQQLPFDGEFPTCPNHIPNPEVPETMMVAINQAKKEKADCVLVSDPDADRLGVAARTPRGRWQILTGNQVGAIAVEYLGRTLTELNQKPKHGVVIETIVTSRLTGDIARSYGFRVIDDLLVGFKYIANTIEQLPKNHELVLGTEESLGYLRSGIVRDKDAAQAAVVMAECTSWLKDQGQTLLDFLEGIYAKYGYYHESLYTTVFPGAKGAQKMCSLMERLRNQPPQSIAGLKVEKIIDRLTGQPPQDNLLIFNFSQDGRTRLAIRPSGTEPKMKFYVSTYQPIGNERVKSLADQQAKKILAFIKKLAK